MIGITYFGCIGNGSFDNTATFNSFVAAYSSTGAAFYAPAGIYNLSAAALIGNNNVKLYGDGAATVFRTTSATDDVFRLGNGSSPILNCKIRDIAIASTVTKTAGWAINAQLPARCSFDDIYAQAPENTPARLWGGINLSGVDNVRISGCQLWSVLYKGIRAYGDIANNLQSGLWIKDSTNITGAGDAGIHIGGGLGGVYLEDNNINACKIGLQIDQTLCAQSNREIFLLNGFTVDSSDYYNVQINGNSVTDLLIDGAWLCSAGAGAGAAGLECGLYVDSTCVGLRGQITGSKIYNNHGMGLLINAGDWNIAANRIEGNGNVLGGTNPGIYFGVAGVFANVDSNTICNNADYGIRKVPGCTLQLGANNMYFGNALGNVSP